MPFQVKSSGRIYRCAMCGKLTSNPIMYKTCCMNRPMPFCSTTCARRWINNWIRNQEQIITKKTSTATRSTIL